MQNLTNLTQKYRQATWRTQRQWLGLILLGVVVIAMIAGLYLTVSNQVIAYGHEIMQLKYANNAGKRRIADMQGDLAVLRSAEVMAARAAELGYEQVEMTGVMYVVVPGYVAPASFVPSSKSDVLPESIIKPEYKQTLFEWFAERIQGTEETGGQP